MTETDARNRLIAVAVIGSSEQENALTTTELNRIIADSVREHNNAYADISEVPDRELEAVLLLSLERVQLRRALEFATQSDLKGAQGYGVDRNTPYYKCIDSANSFRKQYEALVARLNLSTKGDVVVSTVTKLSPTYDRLVPDAAAPLLPGITLALHDQSDDDATGDSYILEWTLEREAPYEFFYYHLFRRVGDSAIIEPWTFDSTHGIPKISSDATKLVSIDNIAQRVARVTGLTKTGATKNRFVVVLESRNGNFKLSNELVQTGSA